jgi:ABC-type Zn uptake system ZnuABC Zn-binding protein ZnuA
VDRLLPAQLGCPHEYTVTAADIRKLDGAAVLVANGLGLDDFAVENFRRNHPDRPVVIATDGIGELLPSLGTHRPPNHTPPRNANPHLFASPKRAALMVQRISEGLSAADPGGRAVYESNAREVASRYLHLGEEMAAAVRRLKKRVVVTQHDVFDYLARDTGLRVAAMVREHPGEDPSAAEILGIIRKAHDAGAGAVFTEPQYPPSIGLMIAKELDVPSAVLDPVVSGPDDPPLDYYELTMRRNMDTLRRTLGRRP